MARMLSLLGLVATLCLPAAVTAQVELGDDNQMLGITGQVEADGKAAQQSGYLPISIAFKGESPDKLVWIGVVKAESWNGDVFAGREMLTLVQGHTPTMIASGKPAVLAKLRQLTPGSRVVVEGIFDRSARDYLVGMVEAKPRGQ